MNIFNILFYQPLLNVLVAFYQFVPGRSFGIAIILLTILIKILLHPLNKKAIHSQRAIAELEPELKKIREEFKDNKERMAQETTVLYKKTGVNPMISLLLLFIQMPVLIALYQVLAGFGTGSDMSQLYSFIPRPSEMNSYFLTIDLFRPNPLLPILAGISSFFQSRVLTSQMKHKEKKDSQFAGMIQKQMNYFLPIFTALILFKLPSALSLYMIISSLISIIQSKKSALTD